MNSSLNDNTDDLRSPLWKISNGKNGDKYLTFSGISSSTHQTSRNLENNYSNFENIETHQNTASSIRVYKLRWFILFVICTANIANAINWIIYSPIADFTGQFYSVSYESVNYLSLVYLIISVPAGFFSFWLIDNFGIRTSVNLGSWFNFLGSLIKVLSSTDSANGTSLIEQSSKFTVLMIGQCLCAIAQPFIMFVTTKFANSWFADDQRALANTIALGSNTLGILIGAFMSPQLVNSSVEFVSEMCLLNIIACTVSLVPALLACFIRRSNPITPPSYSAIINENRGASSEEYSILNSDGANTVESAGSFRANLKIYVTQVLSLLKSKDFLILFLALGLVWACLMH